MDSWWKCVKENYIIIINEYLEMETILAEVF